jgi:hypothetical protein
VESGEDLAVATGEIWRQVAEHVVGLKPIGLFEKEKYWVLFMYNIRLLMMYQLLSRCVKYHF